MKHRYRTLSDYWSSYFPGKVRKIAINAGLGCPNRDGTIGTGGCIYCNNSSFNPSYSDKTKEGIRQQIEKGIKFSGNKGEAQGYLPFFQTFTNTYGNSGHLIGLYEEALNCPDVIGLVIATRPDCISEELAAWFEQRFGNKAPSDHPYLLIELGIESTEDRTLKVINRGHNFDCVKQTVNMLHEKGIEVGAHLILGLPGENHTDFMNHARRISELPVSTLKLHQLQIVRNTRLAELYREDPGIVQLFTPESYAETVAEFICTARKDIAYDRFVSQIPPSMLIAPQWGIKPDRFQKILDTLLERTT